MDRGPLHAFRRRTIALVFLAVSPFAALVLFQGMEDRRHAAQQARAESRRLVRLITVVHRQLLGDARQLLFVLGNVPVVQRADREACTRLFQDVIERYPQYSNLWLAHPDGQVAAAAHPLEASLDRADRSLLEEAAASGGFVQGPLRVTTRRHGTEMSMAQRIEGGRVVLATIELQWLTREAATTDLPAGSSVTVWDATGAILLRYPEPDRWMGRRRPDSDAFQAIAASGGDGTAEAAGVDGVERLYGFGRLDSRREGGPVFLAVGVPSGHAFAEAHRRQRRNLAVLAAVALAAALASRFAGNRFLVPLVERLQVLAETDPLTSLANRRSFLATARREMQRARRFGRPVALVMVDIDRFKAVNDRHGHVAGDAVLREISRRLRATARDADLVARYGGEEFVMLLPECDQETALATAERVRQAVAADPVPLPGGSVQVTVSAGVAVPSEPEGDLTRCLQAADQALYRAKANGRNRVEAAVPAIHPAGPPRPDPPPPSF
jgi:diguanylate cyclase (GGDEF)-like protein